MTVLAVHEKYLVTAFQCVFILGTNFVTCNQFVAGDAVVSGLSSNGNERQHSFTDLKPDDPAVLTEVVVSSSRCGSSLPATAC